MSDTSVGSTGPATDDIMIEIERATHAAETAAAEAKKAMDDLNKLGLKDDHGRTLHFDTIQDWLKAWEQNRGWQDSSGHTMEQSVTNRIAGAFHGAVNKAIAAQERLRYLGDEGFSAAMLKDALDSGDIESALVMLQVKRTSLLDDQLKGKLKAMQKRNETISDLNTKLAIAQGEAEGTAKQQKIADLNGKLQQANNESQLEMIDVNKLVSQRSQTFELVSNMTNKFQDLLSKIIGNSR
jgi:hypothetical protein